MTKFVQTETRWGSLYHLRFFIDGRKVSRSDFDRHFAAHTFHPWDCVSEATGFGFRKTWRTS